MQIYVARSNRTNDSAFWSLVKTLRDYTFAHVVYYDSNKVYDRKKDEYMIKNSDLLLVMKGNDKMATIGKGLHDQIKYAQDEAQIEVCVVHWMGDGNPMSYPTYKVMSVRVIDEWDYVDYGAVTAHTSGKSLVELIHAISKGSEKTLGTDHRDMIVKVGDQVRLRKDYTTFSGYKLEKGMMGIAKKITLDHKKFGIEILGTGEKGSNLHGILDSCDGFYVPTDLVELISNDAQRMGRTAKDIFNQRDFASLEEAVLSDLRKGGPMNGYYPQGSGVVISRGRRAGNSLVMSNLENKENMDFKKLWTDPYENKAGELWKEKEFWVVYGTPGKLPNDEFKPRRASVKYLKK